MGRLGSFKLINEFQLFQYGVFPDNTLRVRKRVAWCLLCVSVKVASLLQAEEIPSEYGNNRNSLTSKLELLESGSFGQF